MSNSARWLLTISAGLLLLTLVSPHRGQCSTDYSESELNNIKSKLTRLERSCLSCAHEGDLVSDRLARLEKAVFGREQVLGSVRERLAQLMNAHASGDSKSQPGDTSGYARKTVAPYTEAEQNSIKRKLSALETKHLSRTYDEELISDRLGRIEKHILGKVQPVGSVRERMSEISAISDGRKSIEAPPQLSDSEIIQAARVSFEKGDLDIAVSQLTKAIKTNPAAADAYELRARCYERQQHYGLAMNDCQQALFICKGNRGASEILASIYAEQCRFDEALRYLNESKSNGVLSVFGKSVMTRITTKVPPAKLKLLEQALAKKKPDMIGSSTSAPSAAAPSNSPIAQTASNAQSTASKPPRKPPGGAATIASVSSANPLAGSGNSAAPPLRANSSVIYGDPKDTNVSSQYSQMREDVEKAIASRNFDSAKDLMSKLKHLRNHAAVQKFIAEYKWQNDLNWLQRYLQAAESLPITAPVPEQHTLLAETGKQHQLNSKKLENENRLSEALQELGEAVLDYPELYRSNRAIFYERHGRPDLAAAQIRECIAESSSDEPHAHIKLALMLEKAGDLEEAEKALQEGKEWGYGELAEFYARHGRYEEAVKTATRNIEDHRTQRLAESQTEPVSAEDSARNAKQAASEDAKDFRLRASIYEECGDYAHAYEDLLSSVHCMPDSDGYRTLGLYCFRRQRFDDARIAFETARTCSNRENDRIYAANLLKQLVWYRQNQTIEPYLVDLLARPDNVGNLIEKAERSFWFGRQAEALKYIDECIAILRPKSENVPPESILRIYEIALQERGRFLEETGQTEASRRQFDVVASRHYVVPEVSEIGLTNMTYNHQGDEYLPRAEFYMRQGKFDLAEADYNRALRLCPSAINYAHRGKSYFTRGKYDLAVQDFDMALGLDSMSHKFLLYRADALRKLQTPKCWRDYRAIAALGAHTTTDCHIKAEALLALEKNEDALRAINNALAYDRTVPWIWTDSDLLVTKAKILYALGKTTEARSAANDAIRFFRPIVNDRSVLQEAKRLTATAPTAEDRPQEVSDDKSASNRWALIVGVSRFANPKHDLLYASKDAKDFRDFLINEQGFKADHIKILRDLEVNKADVLNVVDNWLAKEAKANDSVVLYFSSHGTPSEKDKVGENYVAAYDTDAGNFAETGIPMHYLYRHIRDKLQTDKVVLMLDTCFAGALTQPTSFTATEAAQLFGRPVLCSSSARERSWESRRYPNGIFTRQLINAMRNSKDLSSLSQEVQQRVSDEVKSDHPGQSQTPQFFGQSFQLKF